MAHLLALLFLLETSADSRCPCHVSHWLGTRLPTVRTHHLLLSHQTVLSCQGGAIHLAKIQRLCIHDGASLLLAWWKHLCLYRCYWSRRFKASDCSLLLCIAMYGLSGSVLRGFLLCDEGLSPVESQRNPAKRVQTWRGLTPIERSKQAQSETR